MIKFFIFPLFTLGFLYSCSKKIDKLEKSEISFTQLPENVKRKIFDTATHSNLNYEDLKDENNYNYFQDLNNPVKYEYYTKQNLFFPWIYDGFVREKMNRKKYLIGSGKSVNYIIYGDTLYIPNSYNLNVSDSLTYTFTRYVLK